MRRVFQHWAHRVRQMRRLGYGRPISIVVLATGLIMFAYKLLVNRYLPNTPPWESRLGSIALPCAITGLMAYIALRIYRRMAEESLNRVEQMLRLNDELIEERNHIKSLMDSSLDRIFFKDLDGRYVRASRSVAQAFGLSGPGDVVGRSDFDFWEEDCARQLRKAEDEVVRTGRPLVEGSFCERWRDGRVTWSSLTLVPMRDPDGRVVGTLGIARDITESREREQRLRQLFRAVEQSPHMVVITSRTGNIEYVNPRFCEITGYSADEVMGKNPRILKSGAHDQAFYQRLWSTVLSGAEWRGEILNRHKDGHTFWVRSCIAPIRNAAGEITHLVGVAEDITREKEAEAAIQKETERRRELERIISRSPAIIFLWRNAPGWPVEYVSDNVRQWGYTPEELLSGDLPYSRIIYPDDLERIAEEVQYYTEGGIDNYVQEYRIVRKNGEVRWVEDRTWLRRDERGRITHYQGIVIDITERKQAEEAQRALLEGLRNVLIVADDLIACPTEDALYLRAVELARERLRVERCGIFIRIGDWLVGTYGTGLQRETTDEHAFRFRIDEKWLARLRPRQPEETRWMVVRESRMVWRGDHMEELKEGWVAITPIQSNTQEVIGVLCNDAAITDAPLDSIVQETLAVFCSLLANMVARKRAEEQEQRIRSQQQEVMERADRLHSLGLLAAGLAHEINNPLQAMMSHLRTVERALPADSTEARHSAEMLERGIETIAGLVKKMLQLGQAEKSVEFADARESAEFVLQLLAAPLRAARIKVHRRYPEGRVALAIPRRELIQVLLNLVINARDAMSNGGDLFVEVGVQDGAGFVRVQDTGPGIPADILERIFLPFFTTKGTKGTGLGLSVAESLVRSYQGHIHVESAPGKGATFTVSLPLARAKP